ARHVNTQLYLRRPKNQEQKTGRRFVVFPAKTLNVECRKSNVEGITNDEIRMTMTMTKASFLTGRRCFRYQRHKPAAGEDSGLRFDVDLVHGVQRLLIG